ncbi:MAG: hypothetical protein HKN57_12670 [Xanthomonadales bacterium]|nr:hypothetical protein [Gammaproteobacteria bacterium]MBT8055052.1 hypothetical protein [Gammaproteobacteria bacterium]NND58091.1 hypothetical protein [Xanthomonadales bacterium]NNK51758.1 hypothetical protein [Xanthomonadales bacterium]
MLRFVKGYVLCLMLVNMTACSSMQPVDIENAMRQSAARGVDYGSLVEVKTLERKTHKFRVTEMSADGLGGKPGFFRFEDMQSLRVETPKGDNDSTWSYVLGALGIAALIALVANADSVSVCSPGPCPQPEP